MKFLLSIVVVAIVVFVVTAFADAIDKAPVIVLLIPLAMGAVMLAKEIAKKEIGRDTTLNDFGSGLR